MFGALVVVLFCATLSAQQPVDEKWRIRGTVGYSKIYLDEPGDFMVGGSVGISLPERWSLEPEFFWISGKRFEETGIAVNGIYDFADSGSRVTPYAIFGVGYGRQLDKWIDYSRGFMAINGGFGARIKLSEGLFVAPEGRIGRGAIPRLTVSLGYSF
jgi:hypothetical protein